MATQVASLVFRIFGPLTVTAADGSDRTPKSKRARGVLALLALAPDLRRPRIWLQDKLWSDRGPEQSAGSLRQALTGIRQSLGDLSSCLKADRNFVALDTKRVEITRSTASDDATLFEGLDVRDDEFEGWLREQRNRFDRDRDSSGGAQAERTEDLSVPGLALLIRKPSTTAGTRARIVADSFTDLVARAVSELGQIAVIDRRNDTERDIKRSPEKDVCLAMSVDAGEEGSTIALRLALNATTTGQLLGSTGIRIDGGATGLSHASTLRSLNQFVDDILSRFHAGTGHTDEQGAASLLCRSAIQRFFLLKREDLFAADQLFQQAYELRPRGIYLAWRAYLRTFILVEFLPPDRKAIVEEALALMRRALELEPENSYVCGLCAHVQSIVAQSYAASFELAERCIQLNPANPIGWGCLGIAECYLGKAATGFEHALRARELSGATPFKFFATVQASLAASMAGDVNSAIFLAEIAHGLSPAFKPPMRFLSALYLLNDRHDASNEMVEKMRATEPNFSYDLLRDKSYPASSLHRSKLLEKLPMRQI